MTDLVRLNVRIPKEIEKAIDRHLKRNFQFVNKSDAVRDLLNRGIKAVEGGA